jgi:uncharacterized protein (DUF1499 family)
MTLTQAALAAAVTSVVLVGGSGPAFRAGASLPAALGALAVGTVLGVLAASAAFSSLMTGLFRGAAPSPGHIVALLLSLAAVYLPTRALWSGRGKPQIHDISTDLTDPPTFHAILPLRGGAANDVTFDPEVAQEQQRAYPDILPLTIAVSPDAAFAHALQLARDAGWEIVASDKTAGRIEATAQTRWFGFKDDVVVRLTPAGVGTRVDVRSVSRVGRGDLGANAERVRAYLASLR